MINTYATNIGIGLFVSFNITLYLLVSCSTFLRFSLDCYIFSGCPAWFNLMNFNFPRFTEKEKSISFHCNKTPNYFRAPCVCNLGQMFLKELDFYYGSDFQALFSSLSAHFKNSNSFKLSDRRSPKILRLVLKKLRFVCICLADSSNSECLN